MNRMFRSVCSTLCKAIVLCAFALALVGDISAAFDSQECSGVKSRRHQNELTFVQCDFPGAEATAAYDINERGQITGNFIDAAGFIHQFLLDKGVFTQIDVSGSVPITDINLREILRINDRGQVAGTIPDGTGGLHGYLLDRDDFTQIDVPGAIATEVLGINDRGQLVGILVDAGNAGHGFVASSSEFRSKARGLVKKRVSEIRRRPSSRVGLRHALR